MVNFVNLSEISRIKLDQDDNWLLDIANWSLTRKYLSSKILGKTILLHRLVMNAKCGESVDHVNNDQYDNRKSNLRICDHKQNMSNRSRAKNNQSGLKGVYKHRFSWRSEINVDGRRIRLGSFESKYRAAHEYNKAAIEFHGEFARLNPF